MENYNSAVSTFLDGKPSLDESQYLFCSVNVFSTLHEILTYFPKGGILLINSRYYPFANKQLLVDSHLEPGSAICCKLYAFFGASTPSTNVLKKSGLCFVLGMEFLNNYLKCKAMTNSEIAGLNSVTNNSDKAQLDALEKIGKHNVTSFSELSSIADFLAANYLFTGIISPPGHAFVCIKGKISFDTEIEWTRKHLNTMFNLKIIRVTCAVAEPTTLNNSLN